MKTQINLPRDAEGREIPLDTTVLYDGDGRAYNIVRWSFITDLETNNEFANSWHNEFANTWRAISENGLNLKPELMYLTQPDSLNRLLDDMERAIHAPDPDTYASITCGYFDSANMDCAECERKHDICRETCNDAAWLDIAARIDKLRREDQ